MLKNLLLTLPLLGLVTPVVAAEPNLLRDPGFEETADAWGIHLAAPAAQSALGRYGESTPAAHSGGRSLRLAGTGQADIWQGIPADEVEINTQYVMSLWVNPAKYSSKLQLKIGLMATYGTESDESGLRVINVKAQRPGQWNRIQATYVTKGSKPTLTAKVLAFAEGEDPGLILAMDDFSVTKVTAVAPAANTALSLKYGQNGVWSGLDAVSGNVSTSLLDASVFSGFEVTDATTGKSAKIATTARKQGKQGKGWALEGESKELQLKLTATVNEENGQLKGKVKILDLTKTDRAITARVAFALRDRNWSWGEGPFSAAQTQPNASYFLDGGYAGHGQSAYPFAALSSPDGLGLGIGWPMENPRFYRARYETGDSGAGRLLLETDLGMASDTAKFPNSADFDFVLFPFDGSQHFRGALGKYYAMYPAAFTSIAKQQGLWTLWVTKAAAENAKRANVAYDEAEFDLEKTTDLMKKNDQYGIMSFQYTEPWGFWHPAPIGWVDQPGNAVPEGTKLRQYEVKVATPALKKLLESDLDSKVEADRYRGLTRGDVARAALNSAIWKNPQGDWISTIYNPKSFNWTDSDRRGWDSTVFIANPDPDLPHPNRADIAWNNQIMLTHKRGQAEGTGVDGVFIDSMTFGMGWDRYNFRREQWKYADLPLSFTTLEDGKVVPAQAMALANVEYLRYNHERAHKMGWPVLTNSWHPLYPTVGAYVDVFGAGEYADPNQLLSQDIYAQFRALAYRKPVSLIDYLLSLWGIPATEESVKNIVEPRMNRYLMYGIFPGTSNGWHADYQEQYKRLLAPTFEKYAPIFKNINEAGWEPITKASVDSKEILVERWGQTPAKGLYFTLWNNGAAEKQVHLTLSPELLKGSKVAKIRELISNQDCTFTGGDSPTITVTIPAQRTVALQLQ